MRSQETIRIAQEIKNEIDAAIEKEKTCNEAIEKIEDEILALELSLEELEDEIEDADEDEDLSYEYEERKVIRAALKTANSKLKSHQNQLIIAQYELNTATRRSESFLQQLNESATAASGNIASVSNMVGEYHEIGVQAGNEWKVKLGNYSSAAGVLGATLEVSSGGATGNGTSSHSGSYGTRSTSTSGFSSGSRSGGTSVSHEGAGSMQQAALLSSESQFGGAQQGKLGSTQQPALLTGGTQSGGAMGAGAQQGKLGSTEQPVLLTSGSQSGGAIGTGVPQGNLGSMQQPALLTSGSQYSGAIGAGVPQVNLGSMQQPTLLSSGSQSIVAIGAGAQQGNLGSTQQLALLTGGTQSGGAIGAGAQQGKLISAQPPAFSTGGTQSGGAIGARAQQGNLGSTQQLALLTGGTQSGGAIGAGGQQRKLDSSQQTALLTGGTQSGGAIGAGGQQRKLGSSQQTALLTGGTQLGGAVQVHGNFTSCQSASMPRQTSQNIGGTDNKKSFVEKVYRTLVKHKALQKALLATETIESLLGGLDKAMNIKDIDFISMLNSPTNTYIEQGADRISESSLQDILSMMNYTVGETDEKKTKPTLDLPFAAKYLYSVGTDEDSALKSSDELREFAEEEVKISGVLNAPTTSGKDPDDPIITSIDRKVKAAAPCVLPDKIAKTFRGGNYRTVIASEDMIVYRVFGGISEKQGSFLTTQKPSDKLYSKIGTALKPEWKNTCQYYCEVFIPKGTIMNLGLVEKQETRGGDTLPGGLEQIVVSEEFANNADNYGETRELGFGSGFLEFSQNADKIAEDEE